MRIVVTGTASPLAQALLSPLTGDRRITQIIGIDGDRPAFDDARFTQVLLDLRSPQVARVLAGADAMIHLVLTHAGPDLDAQLLGSQHAFRCAAAQRVRCLIHVSSAAVYQLPARERPITEQHPRAALPGVGLAERQVAFEEWLDEFSAEHPTLRVVRLRPHVTVGTHAARRLRRWLRAPIYLKLAAAPRLQCVHETDVVHAIQLALFKNVNGAFNLACADTATARAMQRVCGGGQLPLPFALGRALLHIAGYGPAAAQLEMLRHDIVLETAHTRHRLGWKPRYDTVKACLKNEVSAAPA
jgi:UDP-glucose 4-epimerase